MVENPMAVLSVPEAIVLFPIAALLSPDAAVLPPIATLFVAEATVKPPMAVLAWPEARVPLPIAVLLTPDAVVLAPSATLLLPEATTLKPTIKTAGARYLELHSPVAGGCEGEPLHWRAAERGYIDVRAAAALARCDVEIVGPARQRFPLHSFDAIALNRNLVGARRIETRCRLARYLRILPSWRSQD